MPSEGNLKKEEIIPFRKSVIILVIILLLIPLFFTIYAVGFREKIPVGIVLTTDEAYGDAETARDGLNNFEGVFEARILDIRLNESHIRISNGLYLTDDYFDSEFAQTIQNEYKVEMILILTDKSINNWLSDGYAHWGQADTKNAIALVTTSNYLLDDYWHAKYIVSTSRHELLHILGYAHPNDNRRCVMRYATVDTEMCNECKLELPYRQVLWKIGYGQEPGRAFFGIRAAISLIFLPIFIAAMIIIQFIFKKYLYKKNRINQFPFIVGFWGLVLFILFTSAFVNSFYGRILSISASMFIYVILEIYHFEYKLKPKTNDDTDDTKPKGIN